MRSQSPNGEEEFDQPQREEWDAHDPRRKNDPFAPPTEPCECYCLHCRRTFNSDLIWFQKINGAQDGLNGKWMCPTPNCSGAGFTFDIFPVDPTHPANEDCCFDDGDEEESGEYAWEDDDDDEPDYDFLGLDDEEPETEYDPSEPHYQMMDEWAGEDDDLEGEEWKHGLEPGQRLEPERPEWEMDEEEQYDQPDRRPRELDWSDLERPERGGSIGEDDIPF
jgi:hypothetical protein